MRGKNWTKPELVIAFNFYCRTPFGRLHSRNQEIIRLGKLLGRSAGSVAMKLVNFASLDPSLKARNIGGLSNAGRLDREVWDEYNQDWAALAFESEQAIRNLEKDLGSAPPCEPEIDTFPASPSSKAVMTRIRLVQSFFRRAVLASYNERCAFCGLDAVELLNASHIIPWSKNVSRRADPTNGLCLCALHDRAFDRGFMTVSITRTILVSSRIEALADVPIRQAAFDQLIGSSVLLPSRFAADDSTLKYHRDRVFVP